MLQAAQGDEGRAYRYWQRGRAAGGGREELGARDAPRCRGHAVAKWPCDRY